VRRFRPRGLRGEVIVVVLAASLTALLISIAFDLSFPSGTAAFAAGLVTAVAVVAAAAVWHATHARRR
jgi:hypothetical protein